MDTRDYYHGMRGGYWRQFHSIRLGGASVLPWYALSIDLHGLLTFETAKSISFGLRYYICVPDTPNGAETLLLR